MFKIRWKGVNNFMEKSYFRQCSEKYHLFSLPYLLSYFLQTLYGMADLFIIGQFEGVASTTAVSIGSQVMHMITVMIVGLAMGSTVTIAQAIGARDKKVLPGRLETRLLCLWLLLLG